MSNSNRIRWPGGISRMGSRDRGRRGDVAAVIDVTHRVIALRRAKIAFWALFAVVGTVTMVVSSAIVTMPLAVVIGLLIGVATGGIVGIAVFVWPVLRVLWHWAGELLLLGLVLTGYLALTRVMPWWVALAILTLAVAGPFGLPSVRRFLMAWVWCGIVRHRLRVAFAALITANRHGTHPLILHARPTLAGERVRIWLRPGLSLADLEARRDKLAVACWGKDVRLSAASKTRAALIDVDITRRNPLTGVIDSPLPNLIAGVDLPKDAPVSPAVAPTALDLPDIPDPGSTPPVDRTDEARRPNHARQPQPATTAISGDYPDWI